MKALVDQFVDYLVFERGLSDNTKLAYQRDLEAFVLSMAHVGITVASQVKREHVVDFLLTEGYRGLAPVSLARRLVAIKVFFGYLVREGLLDASVVEVMDGPKLWKHLPDVLSVAEVNQLLSATEGDSVSACRDRSILELFYATGLRVSELASLRLDAVHFDAGYLRCTGKGRKQRVVPFGKRAEDALKRYIAHVRPRYAKQDECALFVSSRGRGYSRQGLWTLIKRRALGAGIGTHVTPHSLRHSFASHLLANGAQLRVIQELLGHADIATTEIYTHVDQSRLQAAHARFHPRA